MVDKSNSDLPNRKMSKSEAGYLGGLASRKYAKIKHNQYIEKYYKNPKICPQCGKIIPYELRKNKFCSQSCSATFNNLRRYNSTEIKIKEYSLNKVPNSDLEHECLYCKKTFKRTRGSVGKFCSNECQRKFQLENKINLWKQGKLSGMKGAYGIADFIRNYLLKKANYKCELCGWGQKNPYTNKYTLEIHHIDGNYKNNTEDNLQVLCPNCHSMTPNYKNAGNHEGRKGRK